MATDEIPLDQDHINAAAAFAAAELAATGVARVRLAPGDMTEYPIVIAAPGPEWAYDKERLGSYYWVTLCASFGTGYPWHGHQTDDGYAAEKWVNRGENKASRAHVGRVVAAFLTAVAEARRAGTGQ